MNDVCLDSALKVSQVVKGEMSAKTTYQRSAKGPVSIAECSSDGKYICLENTGRKVSLRVQLLGRKVAIFYTDVASIILH
jgi:hypothetical protein